MSKKHQITGLGPVNPDGSRKIFTTQPHPFIVTAAWLDAQTMPPDVGNVVEVMADGTLSLFTPEQAEHSEIKAIAVDESAQKKKPYISRVWDIIACRV